MKSFIACLLMFFSITVSAGDSGIYFDPTRSGEGIQLLRNGDQVVTYLFTHGAEICGLPIPPVVSPEPPVLPDGCELIGQRWFFGVDEIVGNVVSGVLFVTEGLDASMLEQIGQATGAIATEIPVGTYELVRSGEGWLMAINRFGPELGADDPLFTRIYDFNTLLFSITD